MKKRTLTLVLMLVVSLVSLVGLTACEVDTHEHTMQKTEAIAATCTEAGNIEYYTCTDCGKLFADEKGETEITAESTVVAANGHTIVAVNAKEATCTEAGNTAHYKCSVCGKLFSDEEGTTEITSESTVVAAKGHEMTHHEAVPATCTEDGTLEHYSCSVCKKNFEDENGTAELTSVVDTKKGHEMTHHDAVAATCTEDGNKEYYSCSRCNKNFADENGATELTEIVIPANGHDYTFVPEEAKTCTTDGTKAHYVCNNDGCGKKFILDGEEYKPTTDMDLIIYASHEITKIEAKAETCTEDGNSAYYACSACGKYFSDEAGNTEIEANSWVIAAHHTYEETLSHDETSHWYACKNCDDKKDETTHTYGDATFNAIGGNGTHTCTECEYEEAVVDSNPDPDFTKNKYGAVAMWQKDGAFTEHQGAVKSANDGGSGVTAYNALEYVVGAGYIYEDYLPKINFTAFTRVSLKVVFNKYQWDWQIGLSSDKLGNISDRYIAAGNYEGTMTFVWQEGKLVQTLTINGKSFTKTITDEKVFNGNASANLICLGSIVDRRTIHVSDFVFSVPCEEHTYGEATFNAIGGSGTHTCTVCGYEETVTDSNPNPDFTANKLGAKAMWQIGGKFTLHDGAVKSSTELAASDGTITKDSLAYIAANSCLYEDYLPRINFAAFKKVTINISVKAVENVWKFGLSADSVIQITDGTGKATLTFEMQGDKLVQTLTVNGTTYTKEITNSPVINGEESATFYVQDATGRSVFYLSDFTFIAPCETHTYGTSMVYALGKTVQICAVCGHEFLNTEVGELDFTKNKYGATVYWSKDGSALAEHSTAAKNASESSNGIAKNELEYHVIAFRTDYDYLPKINFAAFTTVSMKLSFKAFKGEWKVGLEDSALGAFGDSAFSGDCEGTMTFTMQDGVLTQSLLVNGKTFTKTITDEDVINGNKSALLMCFNNITVQTRYVVSDFTFEK